MNHEYDRKSVKSTKKIIYLQAGLITGLAGISTAAHELLHVLAISGHPGGTTDNSGPNVSGNLLRAFSFERDGRINRWQEETVLFEVRPEKQLHPQPVPLP